MHELTKLISHKRLVRSDNINNVNARGEARMTTTMFGTLAGC